MIDFQEIEDVFKTLEGKLNRDDFMAKVEERFTMMNGLCDSKTAAMLVATEVLNQADVIRNETVNIKDIIPDTEPIDGDCGIWCQYSGTRTCGYCIHMNSFTPIEEICKSCRHLRTFICENCISESRYSPKKSEIDQEREKRLLDTLKFGPASQSERIVFGARRPGYSFNEVNEWVALMKERGIKRICCLLTHIQEVSKTIPDFWISLQYTF